MFKYNTFHKLFSITYNNFYKRSKSSYYIQNYEKFYFKSNKNAIRLKELTNSKHFPPAIREWDNSVYSFNKNNSSYSPVKYNQLDDLMKNYLNLSNKYKSARSKRMRYLRRKSTSRKVFLSKPEIKQTNDKITITVYYFDRDSQVLTRKLLYFNKPKIYNRLSIYRNKRKAIRINNSVKYNLSLSGIMFNKQLKLFRKRNQFKNKDLEQSTRFQLLKYMLSLYNVHIMAPFFMPYVTKNNNKPQHIQKRIFEKMNQKMIVKIIESNPQVLYWINFNTFCIEKIEKRNIKYKWLMQKLVEENKYFESRMLNYKNIRINYINFRFEVNNKLSQIIHKHLKVSKVTDTILIKMFNYLSFKLNKKEMSNKHALEISKISRFFKIFEYNLFKFKLLLPALKNSIDNLYNKKTELNMVSLKYFYLNSDILTQILIFKIRKNFSAAITLKNTLSKINLSDQDNGSISNNRFLYTNMNKIDRFSNLAYLNLNNNLALKGVLDNLLTNMRQKKHQLYNEKDKLDVILNDLYKVNFVNNEVPNMFLSIFASEQKSSNNKQSKIFTILKMVKYRLLLGVWIEAKGRLTRRNTAARSVLNIEYKGNLTHKDQYLHNNDITSIPTVLLRNDMRSNTQYTSKGSVRRIGAFGLKTWLTSK